MIGRLNIPAHDKYGKLSESKIQLQGRLKLEYSPAQQSGEESRSREKSPKPCNTSGFQGS